VRRPAGTRGYSIDATDYQARLRRIEGQVRGLQRMVDQDAYCLDILTQISSVQHALRVVAVGLLDQHLRHCVANDADPNTGVAEATTAIERLLHS
jgi:DNA-binding FrmR family transcriptional regulator